MKTDSTPRARPRTMDPIKVAPNQLLFGKKGIKGWAGGIPTDSQDTLLFAEMTGVPDDRKVSPRKGRRRIRAHDERESQVLRRPDHVRSHGVRQQSKSDCPCSGKDFRRERQVNRR